MKWLIDLAWTVVHPSFWQMNSGYCPAIDAALLDLMQRHRFERVSDYYVQLGPVRWWIGNYPYAAFTAEGFAGRPARRTIVLANRTMVEDLMLGTRDIRRDSGQSD